MVVLIMELGFGRCCGNCVHCNRPKQPQDHEAHYMVAKTERWCYKHKCHITREAVCDSFELEEKKGGVPAVKRARKFNERAGRIIALMERMKSFGIEELDYYGTIYCIHNDWLYEKHSYKNSFGEIEHYYWKVETKSGYFDSKEKALHEILTNKACKEKCYVKTNID